MLPITVLSIDLLRNSRDSAGGRDGIHSVQCASLADGKLQLPQGKQ